MASTGFVTPLDSVLPHLSDLLERRRAARERFGYAASSVDYKTALYAAMEEMDLSDRLIESLLSSLRTVWPASANT